MATPSELAEKRLKEAKEKADQIVKEAKLKLAQAKAQEQRKAARIKMAEAKKERTEENRKKILIGAMYFESMGKDPELAMKIMLELDNFLIRNSDRAVFGLTPYSAPKKSKTTER